LKNNLEKGYFLTQSITKTFPIRKARAIKAIHSTKTKTTINPIKLQEKQTEVQVFLNYPIR
jgi:hypothetical protein